MLDLLITNREHPYLRGLMGHHYSRPKGFVARSIAYGVFYNQLYYGHIVGGSATLYLPGRDRYLQVGKGNLNGVVNNVFYHVEKLNGRYPIRNFTTAVIKQWREMVIIDWEKKYGDKVTGFETLVELPRKGECYIKDDWEIVGTTKGYSCKRIGGNGTDDWGGKRVWNYDNLKPKLVLCRKL